MRRRLSLVLLAIFVVFAGVAIKHYLSSKARRGDRIASTAAPKDSLAILDSIARADARREADTMCLASRVGLPCDPR
jgi:hypothetical protein